MSDEFQDAPSLRAEAHRFGEIGAEELPGTSCDYYGLGWVVDETGGHGHGGSDGTHAWVDRKRELIILVFTQSPGGKNPRQAFRAKIYEACLDVPNAASAS